MNASRLNDLIRYHIVSCELLKLADLRSTSRAVSTSGHALHFSQQQVAAARLRGCGRRELQTQPSSLTSLNV